MKHVRLKIQGKVQGVSFRYYTLQKARELGIFGFVRNESDGSVYAEAEGSDEQLGEFLDWCHRGPLLARVSHVEVEEGDKKGFVSFEILR